MITNAHFLRPLWLLGLIPLILIGIKLWRQQDRLKAWDEICDSHLLTHLIQNKESQGRTAILSCLMLSGFFLILGLAGPTWTQLPVPAYQPAKAHVIVLDLSDEMLDRDLSPNRLSRAKFKLHDLFKRRDSGQWGMVVYTGEPFVVSPLTPDGQTIEALLPTLTPDIMPLQGHRLDSALDQAAKLMTQADFNQGKILVLTAKTPSSSAIHTAKTLAEKGFMTSILPIRQGKDLNPLFQTFAHAGEGQLLKLSTDSSDLEQWLNSGRQKNAFTLSQYNDIPLWRDEGRWFLIPALLFFLPLFRRGWLQGMSV